MRKINLKQLLLLPMVVAAMSSILTSCLDDKNENHFVLFVDTAQGLRQQTLYADQTVDTLAVVADSKCSLDEYRYSDYTYNADGTKTDYATISPFVTVNTLDLKNVSGAWLCRYQPNTTKKCRQFLVSINDESKDAKASANVCQACFLNVGATYAGGNDFVKDGKMTSVKDSISFQIYDRSWTLTRQDNNSLKVTLSQSSGDKGVNKVYLTFNRSEAALADTTAVFRLQTENGAFSDIKFVQHKESIK